jgi:Fic family protein
MDIKDFKSGTYKSQFQYKSFSPTLVNIDWQLSNPDVAMLLSKADIKLGELNAFSQLIPDVDFFIKMHVFKEGTKSSRIEGTQTNIDEALQKQEYILPENRDDWQEVHNYVEAMNKSISDLDRLPISNRLLKHAHHELLQGVRGEHKLPGEYRSSPNWIGGSSLSDAVYIPPHHEELPELMGDLEKFIHNENIPVPHLIKIGIAHYQFETIHPFLDGNGRIGRLLITLYLVSKGLLVRPTLYLSDYFERNRQLYYDNLSRVRTHNDLTQWLKFFLEGVYQTAEISIQTFRSIIAIRHDCEQKILLMGRGAANAKSLLQYLYSEPVVDAQMVADKLNVDISTALRLINNLVKADILKEKTGYKRNRYFAFEQYIALFR